MTTDPVTIDVRARTHEALGAMADLNVRHLPVTEDGRLVGILSDRDLASLREQVFDSPDAVPLVSAVMSGDVFHVDPESEVSEVIQIMLEQKVGAVPVVSAESLEVVGIVSYVDVLRSHADQLS